MFSKNMILKNSAFQLTNFYNNYFVLLTFWSYFSYYLLVMIGIKDGIINVFNTSHIYHHITNVKFVAANSDSNNDFFNFSSFIPAITILFMLYMVSDSKIKFRAAVHCFPIQKISFICAISVGVLLLLNEIWFNFSLPIPESFNNKAFIQIIAISVTIFVLWYYTHICFFTHPNFHQHNYKNYTHKIINVIGYGNDEEIKSIADEIKYSIDDIIKYASENHIDTHHNKEINRYASDFFRLIDEPRFISLMVSHAPGTVKSLFQSIKKHQANNLNYGSLIKNIIQECICNKDSFLYREYYHGHGLYSKQKPISNEILTNVDLITSLSRKHISPFDTYYNVYQEWDIEQFKQYLDCLQTFIKATLQQDNTEMFYNCSNLHVIIRPFENIVSCLSNKELRLMNEKIYLQSPFEEYLSPIMWFIKEIINNLENTDVIPRYSLRSIKNKREYLNNSDFYDCIANLIYDVIKKSVLSMHSTEGYNEHYYSLAYVSIWSELAWGEDTLAKKRIFWRLRRRLYLEIKTAEDFPNFLNMKILGFCLNLPWQDKYNCYDYRFLKAVRLWTQKYYSKIREENIEVADCVITGRLSFNQEKNAIITTYNKGLRKEAPKEYLYLKQQKTCISPQLKSNNYSFKSRLQKLYNTCIIWFMH